MPPATVSRRDFLSRMATLAAAAALPVPAFSLGRRTTTPSILLIAADGLSPEDLGCYGNPAARTPQLDALAARGVRLTDFHACSPVRDPSRLGLLSGRHPLRISPGAAMAGAHRSPLPIRENARLPHLLRAGGYTAGVSAACATGTFRGEIRTAGFGVCPDPEDEVRLSLFNRSLADQAVTFVRSVPPGPYFLDLHFAGSTVADTTPAQRAARMAGIDDAIARVIEAAESRDPGTGLAVFFLSSCGAWATEATGRWRGGRGSLWEGGHRVPAIVVWPDRIGRGTVSDQLACNLDLLPTILAMTGVPRPETEVFDGVNLLPHLSHGTSLPLRTLCWSYSGSQAIRQDRWKYLLNRGDGPKGAGLYDLTDDPAEQRNLLRENPELAAQLHETLHAWQAGLAS